MADEFLSDHGWLEILGMSIRFPGQLAPMFSVWRLVCSKWNHLIREQFRHCFELENQSCLSGQLLREERCDHQQQISPESRGYHHTQSPASFFRVNQGYCLELGLSFQPTSETGKISGSSWPGWAMPQCLTLQLFFLIRQHKKSPHSSDHLITWMKNQMPEHLWQEAFSRAIVCAPNLRKKLYEWGKGVTLPLGTSLSHLLRKMKFLNPTISQDALSTWGPLEVTSVEAWHQNLPAGWLPSSLPLELWLGAPEALRECHAFLSSPLHRLSTMQGSHRMCCLEAFAHLLIFWLVGPHDFSIAPDGDLTLEFWDSICSELLTHRYFWSMLHYIWDANSLPLVVPPVLWLPRLVHLLRRYPHGNPDTRSQIQNYLLVFLSDDPVTLSLSSLRSPRLIQDIEAIIREREAEEDAKVQLKRTYPNFSSAISWRPLNLRRKHHLILPRLMALFPGDRDSDLPMNWLSALVEKEDETPLARHLSETLLALSVAYQWSVPFVHQKSVAQCRLMSLRLGHLILVLWVYGLPDSRQSVGAASDPSISINPSYHLYLFHLLDQILFHPFYVSRFLQSTNIQTRIFHLYSSYQLISWLECPSTSPFLPLRFRQASPSQLIKWRLEKILHFRPFHLQNQPFSLFTTLFRHFSHLDLPRLFPLDSCGPCFRYFLDPWIHQQPSQTLTFVDAIWSSSDDDVDDDDVDDDERDPRPDLRGPAQWNLSVSPDASSSLKTWPKARNDICLLDRLNIRGPVPTPLHLSSYLQYSLRHPDRDAVLLFSRMLLKELRVSRTPCSPASLARFLGYLWPASADAVWLPLDFLFVSFLTIIYDCFTTLDHQLSTHTLHTADLTDLRRETQRILISRSSQWIELLKHPRPVHCTGTSCQHNLNSLCLLDSMITLHPSDASSREMAFALWDRDGKNGTLSTPPKQIRHTLALHYLSTLNQCPELRSKLDCAREKRRLRFLISHWLLPKDKPWVEGLKLRAKVRNRLSRLW